MAMNARSSPSWNYVVAFLVMTLGMYVAAAQSGNEVTNGGTDGNAQPNAPREDPEQVRTVNEMLGAYQLTTNIAHLKQNIAWPLEIWNSTIRGIV